MRPLIPDEPAERFPVVTPDVPHSRTPFGLCHHLRSADADDSCPCGYRGGIWSKPDDVIVFEMGQTPTMVDGKPEKMLPEADRLTQIADAHFIVRACNAHDEMLSALKNLDTYWAESVPGGPDGDGSVWGGIGKISEETCEIWRQIRNAIAKAEGRS